MAMRTWLGVLALSLACCGAAIAGVNNGGAMLLHTDDTINYTTGVNFCNQAGLPTSCAGFNTRTDKFDPTVTVIFAMAAFDPTTNPCVTTVEFGVHHNLPFQQGYIYAFQMCGNLELPNANWPEDNGSGNGDLVSFQTGLTTHTFPFYWFAVGGIDNTTFFQTRTNPTDNNAKFVDCSQPPVEDVCTRFGRINWAAAGYDSCPRPPATGACCTQWASCQVVSQDVCEDLNGYAGRYYGDNTTCSGRACGACCYWTQPPADLKSLCTVTTKADCDSAFSAAHSQLYDNPSWAYAGAKCAANQDSSGTEWFCGNVPVKPTSWGQLKSLFH